jgi:hypothetical protein
VVRAPEFELPSRIGILSSSCGKRPAPRGENRANWQMVIQRMTTKIRELQTFNLPNAYLGSICSRESFRHELLAWIDF